MSTGETIDQATKPRKPRGPSKKTRDALAAAEKRGFDRALNMEPDRGPEMLGLLMWMVICFGAGVAIGARFF